MGAYRLQEFLASTWNSRTVGPLFEISSGPKLWIGGDLSPRAIDCEWPFNTPKSLELPGSNFLRDRIHFGLRRPDLLPASSSSARLASAEGRCRVVAIAGKLLRVPRGDDRLPLQPHECLALLVLLA